MFSPYTSRLHGQDVPRRNRPMHLVAMSEWGNMRTQRNTIPLWLWSRVRRTLVSTQSQRVCLFSMPPRNMCGPARRLPLLLPARSVIGCYIIYPLLQASKVLYFMSKLTYFFPNPSFHLIRWNEGFGKKRSESVRRKCSSIWMHRLRKTTKTLRHDTRWFSQCISLAVKLNKLIKIQSKSVITS